MPARSVAQRQLFAIAEKHPEKLHAGNRGLANLSHKTLHDFAATKERGLPAHASKPKKLKGKWLK